MNPDYGLHYPDWFINFAVLAMQSWHVHPVLWLTAPEQYLTDIIRRVNQGQAIAHAKEEGDGYFPDPYDYEEMKFDDDDLDVQRVEF